MEPTPCCDPAKGGIMLPCDAPYDHRYIQVLRRLLTLTPAGLQRILDKSDLLLFDNFNYHDGKFCPLALAFGCDTMPEASQESVWAYLATVIHPEPVNVLRGVPGLFYHGTDEERKRDLLTLVKELLGTQVAKHSHPR